MSAAFAQDKPPSVIRDTEAEQLLRDYTRPILRAAGLEKQNIQVVIISDARSTLSLPTAAGFS